MTVAATTNRKTYTGDNVTTSFATSPVIFYLSSNLQVRITVIATGVSTLLTENTHYTVSGGSSAGTVGTVNLAGGSSPHGALLSTEKLVILRVLPLTQGVDLVNNNNSDAEVLETALDKLTDVDQQLSERQDRALTFSEGDVSGSTTTLQDASVRAGRLLGFDVTGLLTTFIVQVGTSLVDLASSIGSSLIGFLQSGTGAVLSSLQTFLRRFPLHVKDFGAVGDGVTADDTAFANWTAAMVAQKRPGFIDAATSFYKLTAPWNCTSAAGTNSGLMITGAAQGSVIKFIFSGGDVNVKPGWDLTGCAYGVFSDFSVFGGTSTADCPRAAVLQTGATSGGSPFGGLSTFNRVILGNYGDFVVLNQGAEQIDWEDCEAYGYSTSGLAATFKYVASSSALTMSSPFVASASGTVNSMTSVRWHGPRALQQGNGTRIILFGFTAAGGVESIWHDGFTVMNAAAANPFIIMGDNAASMAGTSVQHCGMRDCIVEATATTGHVIICKNTTASSNDWHFRGRCSIGAALLDVLFQFTVDPVSGTIEWLPNEGGAWSGSALVSTPSGGNLRIATTFAAPTGATGAVITLSGDNSAVSGLKTFNFTAGGSDFQEVGGLRKRGPEGSGIFSVLEVERSAKRITASSDSISGQITIDNVTGAGATTIYTIVNYSQLCIVTGVNSGTGDAFADVLLVTLNNFYVMQTGTIQNAPAGRTYSIAAGNLKVVMAAGTYQIRTKITGCGAQA